MLIQRPSLILPDHVNASRSLRCCAANVATGAAPSASAPNATKAIGLVLIISLIELSYRQLRRWFRKTPLLFDGAQANVAAHRAGVHFHAFRYLDLDVDRQVVVLPIAAAATAHVAMRVEAVLVAAHVHVLVVWAHDDPVARLDHGERDLIEL